MNTQSINQAHKILIVEDEKAMAKAMEVKLQKSGIDAYAVFSGEEAMTELGKAGYTLVLLDIMMPGIDGWEVLAKIKEKNLPLKVIITSNLSQEEDKKKAQELGAAGFLVKSDSTLSTIVEEVKAHME
jgi:DNA-binding response OmpR family regulator